MRHSSRPIVAAALATGLLTASSALAQDAFDPAATFKTKCAMCHGTLAPKKEEMAALNLDAFKTHIAEHQPTGGMVEKLTAPEIEALHAFLQAD
ncbi:hypothetical protein [Afifella sp. IM 167]|uniref:c-type cytochrome n=1 Tax=Afifella sp. IM 167 TaxID=2033586 RepID=UPI001CCD1341|nr:hypothetical protein [Afifella sp. IM 167]MBZ8134834.1 hypothetical protein [Afifella sp. IM 167]